MRRKSACLLLLILTLKVAFSRDRSLPCVIYLVSNGHTFVLSSHIGPKPKLQGKLYKYVISKCVQIWCCFIVFQLLIFIFQNALARDSYDILCFNIILFYHFFYILQIQSKLLCTFCFFFFLCIQKKKKNKRPNICSGNVRDSIKVL